MRVSLPHILCKCACCWPSVHSNWMGCESSVADQILRKCSRKTGILI